MKKILAFVKSYVLLFALHFTGSLLFNHLLHENENIGRTLISSLLFVVVYHFISKLSAKAQKGIKR